MEENLKVDKDYKEAFNLGYELAKELDLKSPMFKDLTSGNDRLSAMQAGMADYSKEVTKEKKKENTLGLEGNDINFKKYNNKDKGSGFDLSL